MRCIAVDDEPLALQLLKDNISKVPFLNLIATCNDGFEALEVLSREKIDLVFIDIQMPGLSGLDFIKSLNKSPMFIFVTAYKKYATDGFDLAVVDYLVKPVPLDRFIKACYRAKEQYELRNNRSTLDYFFVNVDYSQVKVTYDDIMWIEGFNEYVKIYLKSTKKYLTVKRSLKQFESELPTAKFIRIHKSIVIAISEITAYRKSSVFLGENEFSVGDTYRDEFESLFKT